MTVLCSAVLEWRDGDQAERNSDRPDAGPTDAVGDEFAGFHLAQAFDEGLVARARLVVIGVGRQMLEKLGFTVLTAENGIEALEIYKKNQNGS